MAIDLDLHYVDPRLVELYDTANPAGPDHDFYVRLAEERDAQCIIDLGCGTGTLTRAFATGTRRVLGIDPSAQMLSVARRNDPQQRVDWTVGTSGALGMPNADLAVMTGNVAQVFVEDIAWTTTLADIHRALRPGGWLAFESRNPIARGWEQWTPEKTYSETETPWGIVEEWLEVDRVGPRTVSFHACNVFRDTGERLVAKSELVFRSVGELTGSLEAAGFKVLRIFGSWDCGPLLESSRLIILVAERI
jgi:ubiquinone/menaquinone biosynthesis C-methylase UbiE